MAFDWASLLVGGGAVLAVQSVSSGFPVLSWLKGKYPKTAPLVNAAEAELTQVAKAVNPTVAPPQQGVQPLLDLLGGALSHISQLQTLQSYLTQLHLTQLPTTVPQPVPAPPEPTSLEQMVAVAVANALAKQQPAKVG